MVFDVTQEKAVFSLLVDEMTHALSIIELSFAERSLLVTHLAISDLLNKLICSRINDQKAIVRRVGDNQ